MISRLSKTAHFITVTLAVAVLTFGASTALAGEGKRLSGDDLRSMIVGKTEFGSYLYKGTWYQYKEYIAADGSIVGDDGDRYTGSWKIEGDAICADYSTGDKGCYSYVDMGGGKFHAYEGGDLTVKVHKLADGKAGGL